MAEQIYVMHLGERQGPFTARQICDHGGLNADDMVWYEGLDQWIPAADAPLTRGLVKEESYPDYAYGEYEEDFDELDSHLGLAITACVLTNFIVWPVTLAASIPALVCAIIARNKINNCSNYQGTRVLCGIAKGAGLSGVIIGAVVSVIFLFAMLG